MSTNIEVIKELLLRGKYDNVEVVEVNKNRGLYRIMVGDTTATGLRYIAQTGALVQTVVRLGTRVRIRKMGYVHTTSTTSTPSTGVITLLFKAYPYGESVAPVTIWDASGNADSVVYMLPSGSEGFEEPVMALQVDSIATNTHLIFAWWDVQIVSEKW